MRPRLFSLGEPDRRIHQSPNVARFNEAEAVQPRRGVRQHQGADNAARASMRPRLFSLGEGRDIGQGCHTEQRGFNEAEAVQPRRGGHRAPHSGPDRHASMRPRLFSLGEDFGNPHDHAEQPVASMRPRLFSLGEAHQFMALPQLISGFNEAEAVQPRRGLSLLSLIDEGDRLQ